MTCIFITVQIFKSLGLLSLLITNLYNETLFCNKIFLPNKNTEIRIYRKLAVNSEKILSACTHAMQCKLNSYYDVILLLLTFFTILSVKFYVQK